MRRNLSERKIAHKSKKRDNQPPYYERLDEGEHGLKNAMKQEWADKYINWKMLVSFIKEMRKGAIDKENNQYYHYNHYEQQKRQRSSSRSTFNVSVSEEELKKKSRRERIASLSQLNDIEHRSSATSLLPKKGDSVDSQSISSAAREDLEAGSDQERLMSLLDKEVEKIGLFLVERQGNLASTIARLGKIDLTDADASELKQIISDYLYVGTIIVELLTFVGVNLTLLEYVLELHDNLARQSRRPLLLHHFYIVSRSKNSEPPAYSFLNPFSKHEDLTALSGSLFNGLEAMEPSLLQQPIIYDICALMRELSNLRHNSLESYVVEGSLGNNLFFQNLLTPYSFPQLHIRYFAKIRSRSLANYAEYPYVGALDLTTPSFSKEHMTEEMSDSTLDVSGPWPFGLKLNLVATLLYMTNYSVAAPTSVRYVDALDGNAALAAMLIGATPWAVLISTLIFSFITNTSFKFPLILSTILLITGNLLYAVALHFHSLEMVILGRIFIGLSGLRVINRRYIADTAPIHLRTQISAAFVTFSALGTALGPLLAVIFQHVEFRFTFSGSSFLVNGLTAPGYVMVFIWTLFFIIAIFVFYEPDRVGLHQQIKTTRNLTAAENMARIDNDIVTTSDTCERALLLSNNEQYKHEKNIGSNYNSVETTLETIEQSFRREKSFACSCSLPLINWPVCLCLILLFINKLSIESLVSSSPIITEHRYDWNVHEIGALAFAIGILVIPLSIAIGFLSRTFHDGQLLLWLFYFTIFGLLLLIDLKELLPVSFLLSHEKKTSAFVQHVLFYVGPHQYIYGCIFSFVGLQATESIIMSTLSKVVPFELAVGTCNSGLLNTEVGTFGRAIGDLLVTLFGLYFGIDKLLDAIIIPLLGLLLLSMLLVKLNFNIFSI